MRLKSIKTRCCRHAFGVHCGPPKARDNGMNTLANQLCSDQTPSPLAAVIELLSATGIEIAELVSQGALNPIMGEAGHHNTSGDAQKTLDRLANDLLTTRLLSEPFVAAIASEEEVSSVAGHPQGKFVVAFDPLDGSSNIEVNGPIGTIFSVYRTRRDIAYDSPLQFLQGGRQQVCGGYILYSAACLLVLTTDGPSQVFTLDRMTQQFVLTEPALRIPHDTAEFAINMAHQPSWSLAIQRYIQELQQGDKGPRHKPYTMRWSGAMVGDVHRVLLRGGIFLYPSREATQPTDKLRLLYEANPMALLIEHAGGKATTGHRSILDLPADSLHQRTPVILGAKHEVDYLEHLVREAT